MSIALELSRIQTDRNTIRAKLVELGMATGTANLGALATAIDGIVNQGTSATTVRCTGFTGSYLANRLDARSGSVTVCKGADP